MSALDIIDQVPDIARLIVLEMQKLNSPHSDAISTNEAHRRYGRAWVTKHTENGNIKPFCRGNRKLYSISQCERVRAKEKTVARLKD